jgi:hypothetical protein
MNIAEQLREYRSTLDTATQSATTESPRVAPVIRLHPARTLIIAAVAVAAAIGIAFVVVGTTNKRSTPPAGVTTSTGVARSARVPNVLGVDRRHAVRMLTAAGFVVSEQIVPSDTVPVQLVVAQSPVAGSSVRIGSAVTVRVSSGPARGGSLEVGVTVCPTQQSVAPGPLDPDAPSTILIPAVSLASPAPAAYSGKRGFLVITAPAGWSCKAIEAGDGSQGIGVTPPGSTPRERWGNPGQVTKPLTDGVFAISVPTCQGCVYDEICGIVPSASADFPGFASLPCSRPPGETAIDRGNGVYEFDDPAGTIGPDAARSILRYVSRTAQTDATVVRETCILPASQHNLCDTLFAEFFALQPTPWNQPTLTISPTALGAVTLGDNLSVAQEAAGETFDGTGDGFYYSRAHDGTGLHLFVGVSTGKTVHCVGAELIISPHAPKQRVVTPEGFTLGGTVQQLLGIYGSRARYVPAPSGGMTTNAGYVVKEGVGALAFAVHQNKVFEIAGGPATITPNTCTG